MHGMGSGVLEIALPFGGNSYRGRLADHVWVIRAFQKKSTRGIETPKHEVDLVKGRLKRLKEVLQ